MYVTSYMSICICTHTCYDTPIPSASAFQVVAKPELQGREDSHSERLLVADEVSDGSAGRKGREMRSAEGDFYGLLNFQGWTWMDYFDYFFSLHFYSVGCCENGLLGYSYAGYTARKHFLQDIADSLQKVVSGSVSRQHQTEKGPQSFPADDIASEGSYINTIIAELRHYYIKTYSSEHIYIYIFMIFIGFSIYQCFCVIHFFISLFRYLLLYL